MFDMHWLRVAATQLFTPQKEEMVGREGVGGRWLGGWRVGWLGGLGGWAEGMGTLASASPLILIFVGWPKPRLLRVASVCVVVTLAVFHIYLFIYLQYPRA